MKLTEQEAEKVRKYISMFGGQSALDDPVIDDFIDDAASTVNRDYFGNSVCKAVAFLTMHNYCFSKELAKTGGEGRVASKTIGPVSVTYADVSDVSQFSLTKYGRLFRDLIRMQGGGIGVTGSWRYL